METGGLEAAEVGIERGQGQVGADGESGEVGIHPDAGIKEAARHDVNPPLGWRVQ